MKGGPRLGQDSTFTCTVWTESGQSPPVSRVEMAIQQAQLLPGLDTWYLLWCADPDMQV